MIELDEIFIIEISSNEMRGKLPIAELENIILIVYGVHEMLWISSINFGSSRWMMWFSACSTWSIKEHKYLKIPNKSYNQSEWIFLHYQHDGKIVSQPFQIETKALWTRSNHENNNSNL